MATFWEYALEFKRTFKWDRFYGIDVLALIEFLKNHFGHYEAIYVSDMIEFILRSLQETKNNELDDLEPANIENYCLEKNFDKAKLEEMLKFFLFGLSFIPYEHLNFDKPESNEIIVDTLWYPRYVTRKNDYLYVINNSSIRKIFRVFKIKASKFPQIA